MSQSFVETLHAGWGQVFGVEKMLFETDTGQQQLCIFENATFGRVMALDGVIQTTQQDEFIYHEMLAHVPLFSHPNPKRVLIIGGGDGGILREVLRHPGLEQVVQVEIDGAVIDLCRQYFPDHSSGAFDHPKAEIIIGDGIEFVGTTDRRFDVILSDSTDPLGPAEVLFSERFYAGVARCLNPGGIFAAQNGVPFLQREEAVNAYRRLKSLFADTHFFTAVVPTYAGGHMALAWACQDAGLRASLSLETLTARFRAAGFATRYYNPAMHLAAFALPQYLVEACGIT